MKQGVYKREELFVTSKISPAYLKEPELALKKTLQKLSLQYLDLYYIHWPAHYFTINEPMHLIWPKLEKLVEEGLTKGIAVSNFNIQLLLDMLTYCRVKPAANSIELNPYLQQEELVRFLKEFQIVPVALSPIGSMKYPGYPDLSKNKVLNKIGKEHTKSSI